MEVPVGNLPSAIAEWTGEDLDGVRPAVLGSDVLELTRAIEQLDAERLRRFDASGAWQDDGSLSTQAWLRRHCRMAPGAAAERVRVARRLHDSLPETRDAFAAGDIGYTHVRVIARAVESSEACDETIAEAEPIPVDVARDCDPVALRRVAEHWKHMVDADGFTRSERDRYDRRRLHLSTILDGMGRSTGFSTPRAPPPIRTAVEAFAMPLPGDTRTPTQRRADGLVEACRQALDRGGAPTSGGERPHLDLTLALETLQAHAGAPAADAAWATQPISGEAARRLACDCGISRIITNGASEPLDIGRRTRVIPPAMRRAVIARDRHCVAPGCDRPPEWCDVHHRVHWIDGGETKLPNLELRCHPHHSDEHEGCRDRAPP